MKTIAFSSRNRKEIIRDPLSLVFCIGVPVLMLVMFSLMQANVPFDMFDIDKITPSMAVFSFGFVSLFTGFLIAKDRTSSYLTRLFASPLTATNFIIGYSLPLLLIAFIQCVVCFVTAFFFGLPFSINIIYTIIALIPTAILFIGLGILMGCLFNDKQVGGIASILIMVVSFLGGIWYNIKDMGDVMNNIANALPFIHAAQYAKSVLAGDFTNVFVDLIWVVGYALVIFTVAVLTFTKKMNSDKV